MATQPKPYLSPEDYLDLERAAPYKSEYFAGEIFARSGASRRHNVIVTNLIAELRGQLRGRPCEVYPSDMRVTVRPTGLYTYPDVVVVCGPPAFDDAHTDTLLNPTVLFEVLSESTEGYDRGRKFEHYRQLASLQEYVLVAQEQYHVEHYARQADGRWLLSETNDPGETLHLPSLACDLALAEVYDRIELPPTPPAGPHL